MKIGYPCNPRKNIIESIETIGKNGFEFVDIFLEEDVCVPEKINIDKVKKALKKYSLDVVGHTAWYLPIGSPIESIRNCCVKEASKYFKVFKKIGVNYVTIHGNWAGGMFSTEEEINFQIDSLKKLVKEAKKYGLTLIYEPVNTHSDNLKNVSKILDSVSGLYFHLDIGHANLHGKDICDFIKKFHKKLKHVHLHDNSGKKDEHLPMGCGNVNWKKTIKTLKKYYDGTITLEVFVNDWDYVILTKKKLEKLWKTC